MHELEGTLNATRHKARKAEPQAPVELDRDPPAHLSPRQQDGWRYAMEHAPAGVLRRIDRGLLVAWVILEDRLTTANTELQRIDVDATHPLLMRARGGVMVNPYMLIIERCARGMSKLASELGFSPASRPRMFGATLPDAAPTKTQSAFSRIKTEHERRRATTAATRH